MSHPLIATVRARFDQCCGYCGVSEADVGAELTVDHFRPTSRGGDESLDNLVYACPRCNLLKGDFYPSDEERAAGLRVLHPLSDDLLQHISFSSSTGRLTPLSLTGKFHIHVLQLNRQPLVVHRIRKRILVDLIQGQELFASQSDDLEGALHFARSYLDYLKQLQSRNR